MPIGTDRPGLFVQPYPDIQLEEFPAEFLRRNKDTGIEEWRQRQNRRLSEWVKKLNVANQSRTV